MTDESTITSICRLMESRGDHKLPLAPVSVMEHALQTAWLAEKSGASVETDTPSLSHFAATRRTCVLPLGSRHAADRGRPGC